MTHASLAPVESDQGPAVHIRLKVVPGASRDRVAGPLGDRLKVQVSAAPEAGKANKAVLALLAGTLGVGKGALRIVRGETNAQKTVEVVGLDVASVARLLYG